MGSQLRWVALCGVVLIAALIFFSTQKIQKEIRQDALGGLVPETSFDSPPIKSFEFIPEDQIPEKFNFYKAHYSQDQFSTMRLYYYDNKAGYRIYFCIDEYYKTTDKTYETIIRNTSFVMKEQYFTQSYSAKEASDGADNIILLRSNAGQDRSCIIIQTINTAS